MCRWRTAWGERAAVRRGPSRSGVRVRCAWVGEVGREQGVKALPEGTLVVLPTACTAVLRQEVHICAVAVGISCTYSKQLGMASFPVLWLAGNSSTFEACLSCRPEG